MEKLLTMFSYKAENNGPELSKSINNVLADELLLHIFQFCDGKSVKDAALVCVRWNNIIGSSSAIMKKFHLHPTRLNFRSSDHSDFQSQRFHYNVNLDRLSNILFINKFDISKARRILYHSDSDDVMEKDFLKLLSEFKLLESFEFFCGRFPTGDDVKFQMKIKTLRIMNGLSNVLDFVDPEHLIELSLRLTRCHNFSDEKNESMSNLTHFLERAKNLKILSICLFELLEYFVNTKKEIPFTLTRLNISCRGCKPKINDLPDMKAQCEALMATQAFSLTHLSLDYMTDFMFKTLVKNLKKLENLRISRYMFDWSKESQLFYRAHVVGSVKSLNCDDSLYSDIDLEALLGLFPNIENLTLCFLSLVIWNYISKTNPKLKSLKLSCLLKMGNCDGNLGSKINLESLHVEHLYNTQYLLPLLNECSAIRSLEIGYIHDATFPCFINKILKSSLKELRLSGNFECVKKTFEKLKNDSCNLEVLIIKSNKWSNNRRNIFVRFDLPSDKSQWNVKEAEKKFSEFSNKFLEKKFDYY